MSMHRVHPYLNRPVLSNGQCFLMSYVCFLISYLAHKLSGIPDKLWDAHNPEQHPQQPDTLADAYAMLLKKADILWVSSSLCTCQGAHLTHRSILALVGLWPLCSSWSCMLSGSVFFSENPGLGPPLKGLETSAQQAPLSPRVRRAKSFQGKSAIAARLDDQQRRPYDQGGPLP